MRQYDLIERVRSYNPNTNEALLDRAYVYAMKAHGSQTRASGDPFFSHPLEVAAILTDLKLDDADDRRGAAARHDRGYAGDPGRNRRAVRPRHRRPGRGPDQAEEARPGHQGGQAGGEPAQAPAGDRRRRARAARQARGPAAQHAHPRACPPRDAPADGRGDAGYLCAAGRPHGHARDARGARGPLVPRAPSRGLSGDHPAPYGARGAKPRPDRRDRAAAQEEADRPRHDRRGHAAGRSAPIRSGARWSANRSASSSCPTFSGSA